MGIKLENGDLSAVIDLHGAELISMKKNGVELIWSGEAWNRHAPVLFPFVCNTLSKKYTVNGKEYALNNHGFARDSEFEVKEQSKNSVAAVLCSNDGTLKHYPYGFELEVRYTLTDKLLTEFIVRNTGSGDMFFYIGGHPGFCVPFGNEKEYSFEDYRVEYECPETIVQELAEGEHTVIENGNSVPLTREIFRNDVFMKEHPNSSWVALVSKSGRRITVSYDKNGTIAVWSPYKNDADFVCLEPWATTPVYCGGSDELTEMKNALKLPAGSEYSFSYTIDLQTV